MVLDDKFSQGGRKPKIVGKATSSRKIKGAELAREVDLGDDVPLTSLQLRGWYTLANILKTLINFSPSISLHPATMDSSKSYLVYAWKKKQCPTCIV